MPPRQIELIILGLSAALLLLLLASSTGEARTLTVDDDGGADYTSIQEAIDAAEEGDTIRVYEGTYNEDVKVDKTLSLIGNGSSNTTIRGISGRNVTTITADGVEIRGFNISGGLETPYGGIKVESDYSRIINNTLSNNWAGIYIYKSNNNTLIDNICNFNQYGIFIRDSNNNTVVNNTCTNNGNGIVIARSNYNILANNTASNNNYYGISIQSASSILLDNNTSSDNVHYGIQLGNSRNIDLRNNTMNNNGISISGNSVESYNTHSIDTTNRVNGKPIYYYKNQTGGTVPPGAGQIILANTTGMVVQDYIISNGSIGLSLGYSSNNTINNTYSFNNYDGITIAYSENNLFTGNKCSNNKYFGIYLYRSNSNVFINNTCSFNDHSGIYLYRSNSNIFVNNSYLNNEKYGVYIRINSDYNVISNTTISGNGVGIYLSGLSQNNLAYNNTIFQNVEYGISASDNDGKAINAGYNWWGNDSGPYHPTDNPGGSGDNVTDYVDFIPWIGIPQHVHNLDWGRDYYYIQKALDEARPGDTIQVDEYIYYENVVINKTITLIGNGSANTTIVGDIVGTNVAPTYTVQVLADNVTISGFTLKGNGDQYIGLRVVGNTANISDLYFSDLSVGVWMEGKDNQISGSNFLALGHQQAGEIPPVDMYIKNAVNVTLLNNAFTENGIEIEAERDFYWKFHTFINNTVNGKPLYYGADVQDDLINNDLGQIILFNSSNITIEKQNISGSYKGISISYSSDINIQNSNLSNSFTGVFVYNSKNVSLSQNNFNGNTEAGVGINQSRDISLTSNNFFDNFGMGIIIEDSSYNLVIDNTMQKSGIHIRYSSSHNVIQNNSIRQGSFGLVMEGRGYNRVVNNSISYNNGLVVNSSNWNYFYGNKIFNSDSIRIEAAHNNTFELTGVYSSFYGFYILDSQFIAVNHSYIYDNTRGIFVSNSTNISIRYSDIYENRDYGLSAGSVSVNATHNYWGAFTGPYQAMRNPGGEGNRFEGSNVKYRPWLRAPVDNDIPLAVIDLVTPSPGLEGEKVHLVGQGVDDGEVLRYAWSSNIDGEFYNGTQPEFNYSAFSEGNHSLYFRVMDNYEIWSKTVTLELRVIGRPIASIVSISPSPASEGDEIRFVGHGQGEGSLVRYVWQSNLDGPLYNGSTPDFNTTGLSGGNHTLTFRVVSDYGLWSEPVTFNLRVYGRPLATIDSISPNPGIATEEVFFVGHGQGDGTIIRYAWQSNVNGQIYYGSEPEASTKALSRGNHTITFQVMTEYLVWSEPVTASLLITTRPLATIDSISPNPSVEGQTVNFVALSSDESMITRYLWSSNLDGELYNGTQDSFALSNLTPGKHTIKLKVQDNLGFWSREAKRSIFVNVIPTVIIISPKDNAQVNGTVIIKGAAYDYGALVELVEVSINSGSWTKANGTQSWSYEWDTRTVKNGRYILTVRSYDGINYSQEKSLILTVKNREEGGGGPLKGIVIIGGLVGLGAGAALMWKRRSRVEQG